MAPDSDPPADTIIVGGTSDDDSNDSNADDAILDAYDDDEDVSRGQAPQMIDTDPGNDAYANSLDSPVLAEPEDIEDDVLQETQGHILPSSEAVPVQSTMALSSVSLDPSAATTSGLVERNDEPISDDTPIPTTRDELQAPTDVQPPSSQDKSDGDAAGNSPEGGAAHALDGSDEADEPGAIDIQKLVDDITAKAAAASSSSSSSPSSTSPHGHYAPSAANLPPQPPSSVIGASPASLPPKPTLAPPAPSLAAATSSYPQSHPRPETNAALISPAGASVSFPRSSERPPSYPGAPGTLPDSLPRMPPPPASTLGAPGAAPYGAAPSFPNAANFAPQSVGPQNPGQQNADQAYESFIREEQRYTREAKWENFPEGTRIFIGNLSQERVSKRDVWDLFHPCGRLAQISLKNAYGFVQYHTLPDAETAMKTLQGAEVKGRKIHLEYSHRKKEKGRDRSPKRDGNRGGRNDRSENRDQGRRGGRDDYRPGSGAGRDSSSRQNDSRHGRSDSRYDSGDRRADRSRSPKRYSDPYRRRSPTPPYNRGRDAQPALPRRFGSDVPDVQLVATQEVDRNFIPWVQKAFHDQGLRTDIMYLNTRSIPKSDLTQALAIDGVHASVDLDLSAQAVGRISILVFDRTQGSNISWNVYDNLDPPTAAGLALRAKTAATQRPPSYPPTNGYGHPYQQPAPQAYQPPPAPAPAPAAQALAGVDFSSLMGKLDNAAIQQLLALVPGGQPVASAPPAAPAVPPTAAPPAGYAQPGHQPAPPSNIDINALLGNLRAAANGAGASPTTASYGAASYPPPATQAYASAPAAPQGGADQSQMVRSIMSQLANIRQ